MHSTPRFCIKEFSKADSRGNKFFIEIGTKVWVLIHGWFPWRRINWTSLMEEGRDNVPMGHKTWEEAYKMVQELKAQIPTYHYLA